MNKITLKHFHFCCGLGGSAKGFNQSKPSIPGLEAEWRCLGGIDIDPAALKDFQHLAGVSGTLLDLFTKDQYLRFHGAEPPEGWREATASDIRSAAQNEVPDVVFISSPCKGASGLLSESKSKAPKYQALNELTLRCVWLMCEAWQNDPVPLIVFENVPRLATRGRHLLDQINSLLSSYGYAVAETTHDCGEIGGLAQSRKRFLLVARHLEKVPPFLYEPEKKRLQSVGSVLERMPLPGDLSASPMHRIPSLQWKTWVRLAFVEAGNDWRSLSRLNVQDGYLSDYLIVPEYHNGYLGVNEWDKPVGTIAGRSTPSNGNFSIADPRFPAGEQYGQLGVRKWVESTGTVTGQRSPIQGGFSVADPRYGECKNKHKNVFRVVKMEDAAGTVTSGGHPSSGGQAVADPRRADASFGKYAVIPYDRASGTVLAGSTTGQGAFAVADPRLDAAHKDIGCNGVVDPLLPAATDKLIAMIRTEDGTWHRPFTTLELAALQSLVEPEEYFELDGLSDSAWRERIGNAVPSSAAKAIADVMGTTLLLAKTGNTFVLSSAPIWVRPVAIALSISHQSSMEGGAI